MMTAISMFSSNENILSLCNINNVNISNGLSHNGVTATMQRFERIFVDLYIRWFKSI